MKETISRHTTLTSKEVKMAIADWLKACDRPQPSGKHFSESFALSQDGAEWSWQETIET